MTDFGGFAVASRRSAHVLVRQLGGASVQLQIPSPPVAGDVGEELGLRSPGFQMLAIYPAAARRRTNEVEVLVPADVLESALSVQGSGAVRAAVMAASAVQIDDELFVITGLQESGLGGIASLYTLLAETRGTEVV